MLRIIIQEKGGSRQELQLDKKEVSIGRVPVNDLSLPKNNVSKRHAKVVWNNGVWELVDLKSTNGTFVNGQQIQTHRLSPSDQVIIGDFLIQFQPTEQLAAASAPVPIAPAAPIGATSSMGNFAPPPIPGAPPAMGAPTSPPGMPPAMGNPGVPPSMTPPPMTPPPMPGAPPAMGAPPMMGAPTSPPGMPPAMTPPAMTPPPMPGAPPAMGAPTSPPGMPPAMGAPPMPPSTPGMPPAMGAPPGPPPGAPPMMGAPTSPPGMPSATVGAPPLSAPTSPPPRSAPSAPPEAVATPIPAMTPPPIPGMPPGPPPAMDSTPPDSAENPTPAGGVPAAMEGAGFATPPPPSSSAATFTPPPLAPSEPLPDLGEAPLDASAGGLDSVPPLEEKGTPVGGLLDSISSSSLPAQQALDGLAKMDEALSSGEFQAPEPKSSPALTPPASPPPMMAQSTPALSVPSAPSAPAVVRALPDDAVAFANAVGLIREQVSAKPVGEGEKGRADALKSAQRAAGKLQRTSKIDGKLDKGSLAQAVVDELFGAGPLDALRQDPSVTSIMVNGSSRLFVEKNGQTQEAGLVFSSEAALLEVTQRLFQQVGVEDLYGIEEARLPDGTWVQAILPPVSRSGVSLLVRPPRQEVWGGEQAVKAEMLSQEMWSYLARCMQQSCNILITGESGSGCTTLQNALALEIPLNERVVSLEEVGELQLPHANWVGMETASLGGEGPVDYISDALRLRPQRLLLGEVVGTEMATLLTRMVAGQRGVVLNSLAASVEEALGRLEVLSGLALESLLFQSTQQNNPIRQQIAGALDVIVLLRQYPCGSRKVASIQEVIRTPDRQLVCKEVFAFVDKGQGADGKTRGSFKATGEASSF